VLNGGGYESLLELAVIFVLLFSQFPNSFLLIFSLVDFLILLVKGALIIFANGGFAGLNGFAIFIALFDWLKNL
jgi:hypothetical protein